MTIYSRVNWDNLLSLYVRNLSKVQNICVRNWSCDVIGACDNTMLNMVNNTMKQQMSSSLLSFMVQPPSYFVMTGNFGLNIILLSLDYLCMSMSLCKYRDC